MDITNTRLLNIKSTKEYFNSTKAGQKKKEEASAGLKHNDRNKDGKTTPEELGQHWESVVNNLFAGNKTALEAGTKIADGCKSIFEEYSGEDGVLDEYEYIAAIDSAEYTALVNEYWSLRDDIENNKDENTENNDNTENKNDNFRDDCIDYYLNELQEYFSSQFAELGVSIRKNLAIQAEYNHSEIISDKQKDSFENRVHQTIKDYWTKSEEPFLKFFKTINDATVSIGEISSKTNDLKKEIKSIKEESVGENDEIENDLLLLGKEKGADTEEPSDEEVIF